MTGATIIEAEFAQTVSGHLAARVQDLAFLAVPVEAGIKVATGWRLRAAMAAWTLADFSGTGGFVADEAAFRGHVEDIAQHRRELRDLGRRYEDMSQDTPWGPAQGSEIYAGGIVFHSTASHGGFRLDPSRNAEMHAALRNDDGWYEEDCEWSKVAIGFPHLFTAHERRHAEKTLRNSFPDNWEAFHGRILSPSESFEKERRQFFALHAADWIAVSASRAADRTDMILVGAKQGGLRADGTVRLFLVPEGEYKVGRHGFVIDLARHERVAEA